MNAPPKKTVNTRRGGSGWSASLRKKKSHANPGNIPIQIPSASNITRSLKNLLYHKKIFIGDRELGIDVLGDERHERMDELELLDK